MVSEPDVSELDVAARAPGLLRRGGGSGLGGGGDRAARLDREGHVFQNPVLIMVSEPDVSELDVAARAPGLLRRGGRSDLDGQVERLEDSVRGDDCRLQDVVLVGDVADGLEEKLREL